MLWPQKLQTKPEHTQSQIPGGEPAFLKCEGVPWISEAYKVKVLDIASMMGLEQKVINVGQVDGRVMPRTRTYGASKKWKTRGERKGWPNYTTEQGEEWYNVRGFKFQCWTGPFLAASTGLLGGNMACLSGLLWELNETVYINVLNSVWHVRGIW